MEIETVTLPAIWAPALLANEWSGLEYHYPEEAEKARKWIETSGLSPLSCSEQSFITRFDGLLTECLEYYCVPLKGGTLCAAKPPSAQ